MDGPAPVRGGGGGLSARVKLVLVRPKEDGNVGAVARLGRNFGASGLVLVAPRARVAGKTGRDGVHTEAMGYILAELQSVARAHPEAKW